MLPLLRLLLFFLFLLISLSPFYAIIDNKLKKLKGGASGLSDKNRKYILNQHGSNIHHVYHRSKQSPTITLKSIFKIFSLGAAGISAAYLGVSPRKGISKEVYLEKFQDNLIRLGSAAAWPVIGLVGLYRSRDVNINSLIDVFVRSLIIGFPMIWLIEAVFATIIRLIIFKILEPSVFDLTPEVPAIFLPWSLMEHGYYPSRITMALVSLLNCVIMAPIIEEILKVFILKLSVRDKQHYYSYIRTRYNQNQRIRYGSSSNTNSNTNIHTNSNNHNGNSKGKGKGGWWKTTKESHSVSGNLNPNLTKIKSDPNNRTKNSISGINPKSNKINKDKSNEIEIDQGTLVSNSTTTNFNIDVNTNNTTSSATTGTPTLGMSLSLSSFKPKKYKIKSDSNSNSNSNGTNITENVKDSTTVSVSGRSNTSGGNSGSNYNNDISMIESRYREMYPSSSLTAAANPNPNPTTTTKGITLNDVILFWVPSFLRIDKWKIFNLNNINHNQSKNNYHSYMNQNYMIADDDNNSLHVRSYVVYMLTVSMALKSADITRRILLYSSSDHQHKTLYAIARSIYPVRELCGTLSALRWAGKDILGHRHSFLQCVSPAIALHMMSAIRGMKPLYVWQSLRPWDEVQLQLVDAMDRGSKSETIIRSLMLLSWLIYLLKTMIKALQEYTILSREYYMRKRDATDAEIEQHRSFRLDL